MTVGCADSGTDSADEAATFESAASGSDNASSSTPANPYERDRAEGAQDLFDGVTQALLDRDLAATGTFIEPAAPARLRSAIDAAAGNLSTVLWLTEGIAEYVGRKGAYRRIDDAAPGLAASHWAARNPETLPALEDFDRCEE